MSDKPKEVVIHVYSEQERQNECKSMKKVNLCVKRIYVLTWGIANAGIFVNI